MTFERSSGLPAEPAPTPGAAERVPGDGARGGPSPVQLRLQILSTEHWSLLASRSLAWNESFTRAGMYLSTLSGAMVALALVAQVSGFGDAFFLFAVVVLPIVIFVGQTTLIRMGASNYHDAQCVMGMNRIRGAYLEIAPDLEKYFVMGVHDDTRGIALTMAVPPSISRASHFIAGTPSVVMVLNGLVGAILAVIVATRLGWPIAPTLVVGVITLVLLVGLQLARARSSIVALQATARPLFPSPSEPAEPNA